MYGVPLSAVRKYSRNLMLVASSVRIDAAAIVPSGSTTATDSYSGERAAAAERATRAAAFAPGSFRFCPNRTMSGSLLTSTMSPSRLWRYASIAPAVEVERWWMLVTPRAVRLWRVDWIETTLTRGTGTMPTHKSDQ